MPVVARASRRRRCGVALTVGAAGVLAVAAALPASAAVGDLELDYAFTGAAEVVEVPAGYCSLSITAVGASGGDGVDPDVSTGGLGAVVTATVTVAEGDVLGIDVGGQGSPANGDGAGGYGGGGDAGAYDPGDPDSRGNAAGAGGGRTTVTLNGAELVIAGGGGGAAFSFFDDPASGGDAGLTGDPGETSPLYDGLFPGGAGGLSGGQGGLGGVNAPVVTDPGPNGEDGGDAQGSVGGAGGDTTGDPHGGSGGGGGAGAVGGGGGAAAPREANGGGGGGGGSSLTPAGGAVSVAQAPGDGSAQLVFVAGGCPTQTPTPPVPADPGTPVVPQAPAAPVAAPESTAGGARLADSGSNSRRGLALALLMLGTGGLLAFGARREPRDRTR
ncbi:glycine-rich protein [Cellulomonas denverensis]|uniref:Gram-positive cocci surface proteins LPxTG domain-containing protein n=1 Tax=Cellulomonas denverensis TaxID=264297 RepID=A0A7X6KTG3_9CELL|nr:glycine-rich protein [Cellulomonas denverensis]NKY21795.1 hypothetical protein [Cellulomonas denverensis]